MKNLRKLLLGIAAVFMLTFACNYTINEQNTVCFADFGDSNDYSGGSDSGWSDSGSDWGSSSSSDYSSGSGGGFGCSDFLVAVIIIVFVIVVIIKNKNNKGGGNTPGGKPTNNYNGNSGGNVNKSVSVGVTFPDRTTQITEIIRKDDEFFDTTEFVTLSKNIFVDIQNAWSERNLETVRDVLHPNLYNQTQTQVNAKIRDGLINKLERISITNAYITAYSRGKEFETVTVFMDTQMVDYQIRESTGQIVAGDMSTLWKLKYKMTLERSIGVKTPQSRDEVKGFNCPNCGAPLPVTSFGKCEYCDSIIESGKYGWVVSSLNNTKNDTRDEGIKGV